MKETRKNTMCRLVLALALLSSAHGWCGETVFEHDFAKGLPGWRVANHEGRLGIAPATVLGEQGVKIERVVEKGDSAWGLCSPEFTVRPGGYLATIRVCGTLDKPTIAMRNRMSMPVAGRQKDFACAIFWLDAAGNEVCVCRPYGLPCRSNEWTVVKFGGDVPAGAVKARLSIGADAPEMREGDFMALSRVRVSLYAPKVGPELRVSLRDDGMTLVGGKPFFPIGIYSVASNAFNGGLRNAFAELKAIGINTVHTYRTRPNELLDMAAEFGMKAYVPPGPSHAFDVESVMELRNHPALLAWYLDDDTYRHTTPEELASRHFLCKTLDDAHLTSHADDNQCFGNRFHEYVNGADIFLPEIYPCGAETPLGNEVACVIGDMERIASAFAETRWSTTKAAWAIIQDFDGWNTCERYPTAAELRAMTYAAIVHGARGVTWYSYAGSADCAPREWRRRHPDKAFKGRGVRNVPERWKEFCALVPELAAMQDDLSSRDAGVQPKVEVLEGPRLDRLGFASVSCLLKETGLLLAVNSTTETVKARISFRRGDEELVREIVFPPYFVVADR